MLKLDTLIGKSPKLLRDHYYKALTLPYERRIISRQRVTLDDGSDAGLFYHVGQCCMTVII